MATIELTVIGSDIGTLSSKLELSQADSDRLMAFLVDTHGVDEEGNPRTPQGMIEAYWTGITAGTLANVKRYEQEREAKAARDAVTDIVVKQL